MDRPNFIPTLPMKRTGHSPPQQSQCNQDQWGYALPMAMGLGLTTIVIGMITIKVSQNELQVASSRQEQGINLLTAEGHVAKVLADLTEPQNTKLLTLNYDPEALLGPDQIPSSGDEGGSALDEWTPYQVNLPCAANLQKMATSDAGQGNTNFTINAYRFNPNTNLGTLLLQGNTASGTSSLLITVEVGKETVPLSLPGVIAFDSVQLAQRKITGANSNLYFDPDNSGLNGMARRNSPKREKFLQEIEANNNDLVQGNLLACTINPTVAFSIPQSSTKLDLSSPHEAGVNAPGRRGQIAQKIETENESEEAVQRLTEESTAVQSSLTSEDESVTSNLKVQSSANPRVKSDRIFPSHPGQITHYKVDDINLEKSIIDFDTTHGPIYLYVQGEIELANGAKIRNVRGDRDTPQVGDLRIFSSSTQAITLKKGSCIKSAFVYAPYMRLKLNGGNGGCPKNKALLQGVPWVKRIDATQKGTAGIHVPNDLSSLDDVIEDIHLSNQEKIVGIHNWLRINF